MTVVAGPSGSGKSTLFAVAALAPDAFNVDDRAAREHGSYAGIPPEVRTRAQRECEKFVANHIEQQRSFAVESTLRSDAALRQAAAARAVGFTTFLIYVCAGAVAEHLRRVALRGRLGGHSAPESEIRDIYARSLGHLATARGLFDEANLYDSSERWGLPRCVVHLRAGRASELPPVAGWVPDVWRAS